MAEWNRNKRPANFKDIAGQKFGRLTAVEFSHIQNGRTFWVFVCNCGSKIIVEGWDVRSGHTKSCGCFNRETATNRNTTHGMSYTPEFQCWTGIINRCTNKKDRRYADWGGRGITVCDSWIESFENFYSDMGPRPSPKHSIERIDNDGPYCKENCKWATQAEQNKNKRPNKKTKYITIAGNTQSISAWSRELGIARQTVIRRHGNGVLLISK